MTRLIPRRLRHGVSRTLGELDARAAVADVRALAAVDRPILAGPWTGEVGFEVLYWIPFLRWVLAEAGVPRDRVVACSRGGVAAWYRDIAAEYVDVFDFVGPSDLRAEGARRKAAEGAHKQTAPGPFDAALVEHVSAVAGSELRVLHPSAMFRVYRRYLWQHADPAWLHRYSRYRRWPQAATLEGLPRSFVAVKFYVNDCVVPSPGTRDAIDTLVGALAAEGPVVSLETGHSLDDHAEIAVGTAVVADPALRDVRTNLGRQAAILSRARAFVGTYGGYAYLPGFYGVPAAAVFTEPGGFARTHLQMAQSAFSTIGAPPLNVLPLSGAANIVRDWYRTLEARA